MDKRRKIRNNKNGRGARNNGSEPDQPQAQRQPSLKKKEGLRSGALSDNSTVSWHPSSQTQQQPQLELKQETGLGHTRGGLWFISFLDKDAKHTTAPAYQAEV